MPRKFGPFNQGETVTMTHEGVTVTVAYKQEVVVDDLTLTALGGRWNEIAEPLEWVDYGVLKNQPDGTSLLDLSQSFAPRVINGETIDGRPVTINAGQRITMDAFGPAKYYMFETDPVTGNVIVEPGDYTRDIYVSTASGSLTRAAIAAAQTPPVAESVVTGAWLLARPEYGGSPEMKVVPAVATMIVSAMYSAKANDDRIQPSEVLYFERGIDYTGLFNLDKTKHAESPLHPRQIRAFGTGTEPTGVGLGGIKDYYPSNIATVGVSINYNFSNFENVFIADADFKEEITKGGSFLTFYRTGHFDVARAVPSNGVSWSGSPDRNSGIYLAGGLGTLLWGNILDHNGFAEPYKTTGEFDPVTAKQPPTIYSHNLYFSQFGMWDITWEDILSMRSASVAGQLRSGGLQLGCTAVENGVGWQNQGRFFDDTEGARGTWPVTIKCVATMGTTRSYQGLPGGKTWAFDFGAVMPVVVDTLAMHVDVPEGTGIQNQPSTPWQYGYHFTNHVEYDWKSNQNVTGLNTQFMDLITLLNFAKEEMEVENPSRADFYAWVRTLSHRERHAMSKRLNRYFLSARVANMELPNTERTVAKTLYFRPDTRAEGFRSDNPLNWDSKDTPINGDSLDLQGNRVVWVKETRDLNALIVGADGVFEGTSGKASFESMDAGAKVKVDYVHKLHIKNFNGNAEVRGGRFINIGNGQGNIDASGRGEVVLGDFTVGNGKKLRICGDMGKVGWDAIAPAGDLIIEAGGTLEFHATPVLRMSADPKQLHLGRLEGSISGATGEFDSWRRKEWVTYTRIRDLVGTPVVGENVIKGNPEEPTPYIPTTMTIAEILSARIGKIETGWRGRIGAATGAAHNVILTAGSIIDISNRNLMAPNTYTLTGPGVTVIDQGATLPAGVSVTGGKLVLTVN